MEIWSENTSKCKCNRPIRVAFLPKCITYPEALGVGKHCLLLQICHEVTAESRANQVGQQPPQGEADCKKKIVKSSVMEATQVICRGGNMSKLSSSSHDWSFAVVIGFGTIFTCTIFLQNLPEWGLHFSFSLIHLCKYGLDDNGDFFQQIFW